jgi:hypothetical protein
MARREKIIKSPQITIIGEGLTERCYFTNLKKLQNYRYTCKPRNFAQQYKNLEWNNDAARDFFCFLGV